MKKKTYTKYDYCRIQTEMGVITSVFSLAALSLALLLGAVVEGIHRYRMDGGLSVTSLVCLAVFALNLPLLFKNAKRYRSLQKRLRDEPAEAVEKDPDFQKILPTKKQLWLFIVLLGILALTLLGMSALLYWVLSMNYESIVLVMLLVFCAMSIPLLLMAVQYIRLLPVAAQLEETEQTE